jgi:uncharacterized membrane protein
MEESFKRKTFYVSGFDPRGPGFYHKIFKQENKKWGSLFDKKTHTSKRSHPSKTSSIWTMNNETDNVACDYSFLRWDDIIRENWQKSPIKVILKAIIIYCGYYKNYNWKYIKTIPQNAIYTFLYPIYAMFLSLLPLSIIGIIAFYDLSIITKVILIAINAAIIFTLFYRIRALWLLRLYIFHYDVFSNRYQMMDDRIDIFAREIIKSINGSVKYDEIILVGHSYGSVFIPLILEKIMHKYNTKLPENFTSVTFGNLIPLITALYTAKEVKKSLNSLINHEFTWIDISSPADGACFALTHPLTPMYNASRARIIVQSPAFHKFYTKSNYKKIKKNKFLLHFQYLYCTDLFSDYNYIERCLGKNKIDVLLK